MGKEAQKAFYNLACYNHLKDIIIETPHPNARVINKKWGNLPINGNRVINKIQIIINMIKEVIT